MDTTFATVNDNSAAHRATRPVARPSGEPAAGAPDKGSPQPAARAPGPGSELSIVQMVGLFHTDYVGPEPPPKYRRAYRDAVDRVIPAEWRNGRWYAAKANLPLIAKTYGLVPKNTKTA
jgi:hypothetical protein